MYSRIKLIFGLAALVASLAAVPAASADVICANNTSSPCSAPYAGGTKFNSQLAPGTSARLTGSFGTLSCLSSTKQVQNNATSGTPLPGQINSLTFSNCTLSGTACTVTMNNLPWVGNIAHTSNWDGTLTITASTMSIGLSCGGILACTLSNTSSGFAGTLKGGTPLALVYTNAPLNGTGICSGSTFTATYDVVSINGNTSNTTGYVEAA